MISAPASGGGPGRRPAAGDLSAGAKRLAPFGFAQGQNHFPRFAGAENGVRISSVLEWTNALRTCVGRPDHAPIRSLRSAVDDAERPSQGREGRDRLCFAIVCPYDERDDDLIVEVVIGQEILIQPDRTYRIKPVIA